MIEYHLDARDGFELMRLNNIIKEQRKEIERLSADILRYLAIIDAQKQEINRLESRK